MPPLPFCCFRNIFWSKRKIRLNQNECNLDFIGFQNNRNFSPHAGKLRTQLVLSHSYIVCNWHCNYAKELEAIEKKTMKKKKKWKEWSNHISLNRVFKSPNFVKNLKGERKMCMKEKYQRKKIARFFQLWLSFALTQLRIQTNDQFRCYFLITSKDYAINTQISNSNTHKTYTSTSIHGHILCSMVCMQELNAPKKINAVIVYAWRMHTNCCGKSICLTLLHCILKISSCNR